LGFPILAGAHRQEIVLGHVRDISRAINGAIRIIQSDGGGGWACRSNDLIFGYGDGFCWFLDGYI
jgi:hypothetical protein